MRRMNGAESEAKPSRLGWWLVLIPVLVVTASWWFLFDPAQLPDGFDSSSVPQTPSAVPPVARQAPVAPPANERDASSRTAAVAPAADEAPFVSTNEDDEPIENPVRDGLVLRIRDGAGAPCAAVHVRAVWRKGFGLYGRDEGRADANGTFATTVARPEQFELFEIEVEGRGELQYVGDVLPAADDPRAVDLVVPGTAPLRVHVVDETGVGVADAKLVVKGGAPLDRPRQHVLSPSEPLEGLTGKDGKAAITVCHGSHVVAVSAAGCTSPETVRAIVGPDGGDATVVVLRIENRIEIPVEVTTPPGAGAPKVVAWSEAGPPRSAELPGRSVPTNDVRKFRVDTFTHGRFSVAAEDVAWECAASAEGCATQVVTVPRGQRSVSIALVPAPPPPPVARLIVTVMDVDGSPAIADVRVHETPDYVYGSDTSTERGRVVIVREPGKRVCVSARAHGKPWVVSEPIDLTPGDHEVTLQLLPPQSVTGRVVDAQGNGVLTRVVLHRPAGPLRGLAPDVPEIAESCASGDTLSGLHDGRFWFHACGPGEHVVWAFPESGWPAKKRVVPGVEVTIVVGEGIDDLALIEGVVRDDTTLVPLANVVIESDADVGGWHKATDAEGRFRMAARPGDVAISMRLAGYVFHTVTTPNVTRGPRTLELRLPRSPVLFLRIVDAAGQPIDDAEVSVLGANGEPIELLDQNGNREDNSVRTNSVGRVDLRGAPAGVLKVRVERGDAKRDFDVPASAGRDGVFDVRW